MSKIFFIPVYIILENLGLVSPTVVGTLLFVAALERKLCFLLQKDSSLKDQLMKRVEEGKMAPLYEILCKVCFYGNVHQGTTNFFIENDDPDPLIDAKLKSKTHLENTFFDLLSRLLWNLQVQKIKMYKKTQNFMQIC